MEAPAGRLQAGSLMPEIRDVSVRALADSSSSEIIRSADLALMRRKLSSNETIDRQRSRAPDDESRDAFDTKDAGLS